MEQEKFLSLRWKIIIILLMGTVLFGAVTLIITRIYLTRLFTQSLIEQGEMLGRTIGEVAAEKLIEDDIVALKAGIEKFRYLGNVRYILIEDFNNQIITDTYNKKIPKEIRNVQLFQKNYENKTVVRYIDVKSENSQVYDIYVPIKEGLLGFVRVGMNQEWVQEKVFQNLIYLGLVFFIGSFLAVIIIYIVVTSQITRPIAVLTENANRISLGEFDRPVRVTVKNEIGVLAEAIERMRESLKTALEKLRKKNQL